MSLQVETSKTNVLILYSLGCMVGCMLTSLLALSAVIYKNGGLLSLLNGGRRMKTRNSNNFHRRNAKENYSIQETEVGMPCSRDELEKFVVRVESSKISDERVTKGPVFSSPWTGIPVEEEEGNEGKYDKPRSPSLRVTIPIEIEPKRTEPGVIEDNMKNEEIYFNINSLSSVNSSSSPSLNSNKVTVNNYANCRRDAMFLPMPPSSSKQKQQQEQQGGQEYERMNLEHIYDSIDSVSKDDFLYFPKEED